jgi:outer membrane biosynthesis protein TonB
VLLASLLAAAMLPGIAAATEIYRWVDAQGTAHIADKPPKNPPANMTRETLPSQETSPQQQREAQERVQRDQQRSRTLESQRGAPAGQAPVARPSQSAGSQDCKARWAAYERSQACFAPYRTAEAGLKPEAFAACGADVVDPSPDCGPQR